MSTTHWLAEGKVQRQKEGFLVERGYEASLERVLERALDLHSRTQNVSLS